MTQAGGHTDFTARLKAWAREIKTDVVAISLAAGDRRVPWYAKLLAAIVAAYALSPIDLIPDFIPVLGYLDDVILVPLGILLVVRLIPPAVMAELRAEANARAERPASRAGATAVVVLWIAAAALLLWAFWPDRLS
ncbi:MAG TPA: YkvA family protein [Microvirga sp.]|nr:YkvA family protein [Microvirga sp.]